MFAGKRKEANKRSQRRYMGLYIKLSFKWENKGHIIEVQVQELLNAEQFQSYSRLSSEQFAQVFFFIQLFQVSTVISMDGV